jgi:putative ABC transport system permease protein
MTLGDMTINGRVVPAIGIDPIRGVVAPMLASGRMPRTNREVVLGDKTMRLAHAHVGQTFTARIKGHAVRLRVVGRATLPSFGAARFTESGLGTGVLGRAALLPPDDPSGPYNYYLFRYDPASVKEGVAKLHAFLADAGCADPSCVLTDERPAEIEGYRSASGLPVAVATILTLLLVATLTHVLASTMARRRGDLAVLRAMGLAPRQLASVMRWQAVVLTGAAIVIGVPIGLLANQLAWRVFTHQLGIEPGTVHPVLVVVLGAIAVLALALALSTVAGSRVSDIVRRHRFIV